MPDTQLESSRLASALASGGRSSDVIHAMVLAAAGMASAAPEHILDFGSGGGRLLPALAALYPRAELHGADLFPRPEAIPADFTWHRGDLNHDLPIRSSTFDLICAVEVIEHLENPRHMLREVARLLKPGGAAVLSRPNVGSWRSLITFAIRGHHAMFDDSNYPAHITPVGEIDFQRAGQEAGLCIEGFVYTDRGTIPKLLTRYWQDLPLAGRRLTGRRFSDNYAVVYRKR